MEQRWGGETTLQELVIIMGHSISTGKMLQGRSGIFGADAEAAVFPTSTPRPTWWFDAQDLVDDGIGNLDNIGNSNTPDTVWDDKEQNWTAIQTAGVAFEPILHHAFASFGSGLNPVVFFDGGGAGDPSFLLTDSGAGPPTAGGDMVLPGANHRWAIMFTGHFVDYGSLIGDNDTGANLIANISWELDGPTTAGQMRIEQNSANTVKANTSVLLKGSGVDLVILLSQRDNTFWDTWVNGVQIDNNQGTFQFVGDFSRLGRTRDNTVRAGAQWYCRHKMIWDNAGLSNTALTNAQAVDLYDYVRLENGLT